MSGLTNLQREQQAKYGVPLRSTFEQRRLAVLDSSVYNVLSNGRADRTIIEVLAVLETAWQGPSWLNRETLNAETVEQSAKRLVAQGLIQIDGAWLRLPRRGPSGHGPPIAVDYFNGRLVGKR